MNKFYTLQDSSGGVGLQPGVDKISQTKNHDIKLISFKILLILRPCISFWNTRYKGVFGYLLEVPSELMRTEYQLTGLRKNSLIS